MAPSLLYTIQENENVGRESLLKRPREEDNFAGAASGKYSRRTTIKTKRRRKNKAAKNWKKGIWDTDEDEVLLKAVNLQRDNVDNKINWAPVSELVKTRSCKQCRERWVNHLNPQVRKTKWLPHEDEQLLHLGALYPKKWAKISREIPGRTENMVKIRWNSLNRANKTNTKMVSKTRTKSVWSPPIKQKEYDFESFAQPLPCNFLGFKFNPQTDFGHPPEGADFPEVEIDEAFWSLDNFVDSFELSVL
mmetsp:Transcript_11512/g.13220  ORF Transcript_11512/g.13220 Transcript_11512/m.13220 type:complete len:248 (+) Transcript_11512:245-988(+)